MGKWATVVGSAKKKRKAVFKKDSRARGMSKRLSKNGLPNLVKKEKSL